MADEHSAQALGPNEWLVDEMYEQYRADPSSVSQSWQDFFADYRRDEQPAAPAPTPATAPAAPVSPAPGPPAPAPTAATPGRLTTAEGVERPGVATVATPTAVASED